MTIYDSMRKAKVELQTLRPGEVGIYLCGPTVYDYGHLGHGRSAIVFDLLRRYLRYRGYGVTFVRNWTDIDDKTIDRANREGVTVAELTKRFIAVYEEDFQRLNILPPDHAPRPTEHIPEIVAFIGCLFDRGHAYLLEDGVYFDIRSLPEYGVLSGQSLDELRSGARVEVSGNKRSPGDFVLWKLEKPGEPSWHSPWGRGRPGWHIECSVMSTHYLGEEFDIHCGGQDLTFPHHEDEIAQARGVGYGFARYWMHNGFVNIDDEKMSKSMGNFFTLREIFRDFDPPAVRFFLLGAHYKAPLNFSREALEQAESGLRRFNDFILRLVDAGGEEAAAPSVETAAVVDRARVGFREGMDDDMNVSRSLAALSELVRDMNARLDRASLSPADASALLGFFREIDAVLGVFTFGRGILPGEVEALIREREEARKQKDFARADRIRDRLAGQGIILEDTREGTRWKRS